MALLLRTPGWWYTNNMNKTLKFPSHFTETIKTQASIITTRLFDEKNLNVGDTIDLLTKESGEKFASGKITKIQEKTFADVLADAKDPEGLHKMYEEDYYHQKIDSTTPVKFIHIDITRD
jgi:hypothetical protein